MVERSSPDTEGLDQCPVCRSRIVSLFERQEGLFVVSCENDDCGFVVEALGGSAKEAVRNWNTRAALQPAPPTGDEALRAAAERVCWFDWSDNDTDAAAAIDALRMAVTAAIGPASPANSSAESGGWHRELIDREPDHGQYGYDAQPSAGIESDPHWQARPPHSDWRRIAPEFVDEYRAKDWEVRFTSAAQARQEPAAWRYEIQHGPDGQIDYAWVYDGSGNLVCTTKTHYAIAIVDALAMSSTERTSGR